MAGMMQPPQQPSASHRASSPQQALFGLRARLTWRRYTAQKGRIVWAIIAILIFLPLTIGLAFASWIGYIHLPDPWPFQLLAGILTVMWLIWIVFPILFAPLNEGIDLERLLIYPLKPRDLAVSSLLGTLFDYTTYLTWPLFIAIVIAFAGWPVLLVVVVALLLVYGNMVLTSQLMLTALGGVLQSRRFRDVAIVVMSLSGFACWGLSQAMQSVFRFTDDLVNQDTLEMVGTWRPLNFLQWLPPGAAARAIERASYGDWPASLFWLAYVALILVLIAVAWTRLVGRLLTGQGFWLNFGQAKQTKERKPERTLPVLGWFFSAETLAIARKEYQSAWRIPQRRIGTLQGILLPFIILGFSLFNSNPGRSDYSTIVINFFPLYILLTFWIIGQNMLGWEHKGLAMLLLTPVRRRHIFRGKILVLAALAGFPYILFGAFFVIRNGTLIDGVWTFLGLLMGLNALAVLAATSVLFPLPVRLEFKRGKNARSSGGCLQVIGSIIVTPLLIGLVNLPLLAVNAVNVILPQYDWIVVPAALLAIPYAALLLWVGVAIAERLLLQREPEVLEAIRPIESD
ncbi:MAG: hypothetical protein M9918_14605 [Anaerolineae bacterium]|nr:hypothetical protein [Anaerolineae bacterium]